MRPKPFIPISYDHNEYKNFVQNETDGRIWHKSKNRILYIDTDQSRVVYHSNYFRYFEFGRASLMRELNLPYREIEDSGYVYPIISLGANYHSPLFYDDPICVYTALGELKRVKLKFDYIITNETTQKIACIGFTEHCALNTKNVPVAIDPKTVNLWKIYPNKK